MIFINHKGENIYVNKRCEEIMGYTKDELCAPDFSFLQLIAPENHTRQMQNLSAHFRGEDVTPSTFTVFD